MMQTDLLEPVTAFQLVLENVSLGDIVQSPDALHTFQKFLQSGTVVQRQQLLMEAPKHSTQTPSSHDAQPLELFSENDGSTIFTAEPTSKIGHKRPLHDRSQQSSPRTGSARKRKAPAHMPTLRPSNAVPCTHSLAVVSSDIKPPEQCEDDLNESQERYCGLPIDTDATMCSLMSGSIKRLRTPSYDLSNNPPAPNILEEARQFFEARLASRKNRTTYLVRAIKGFLEALQSPRDSSKEMWNAKSAIFSKPQVAGSTARFRSLYDGHRKIKRGGEQYLSATRFCYIYLEHDLEQIIQSQELVLSQGRGKVTAAFQLQAKSISITMDALRAERKAGRGYIQLLMEGGPGFVLRIGSNVSTIWERKLSLGDITLIIEFVKTHAADLYDEIKSYDQAAVRALLDGFIAYGWTRKEIRETKSTLFDELQRYVNLDDLCDERVLEDISNIASLPTPTSDVWDYEVMQSSSPSPLSDLDLLVDEENQSMPLPTNVVEDPESILGFQDGEYIGMTAMELNQLSFDTNLDMALSTLDTLVSETQDDLDLFQELFPELSGLETSANSLNFEF